ncbi:MAG: carboxypeptidase-like regulatory domain-containing protein [Flavobacteriaceae bacterium]
MRRIIYLFVLFFPLAHVLSQSVNRVEIEGKVFSKNNEVESVTVFNTSSNKGTITNENGEFTIVVALNDVLEISALQYRKGSITITEEILNRKSVKIHLIENVTTLQEVVILPYDLTGNLVVDTEEVNLVEPIPFELGNMNAFELPDDQYTKVVNPFMNDGQLMYGADLDLIFGYLLNTLFKPKYKLKGEIEKDKLQEAYNKSLEGVLGRTYIINNFNIAEDKVEAFIVFVENNGIDRNLLLEENRMQLIEFLHQQSELFLKS